MSTSLTSTRLGVVDWALKVQGFRRVAAGALAEAPELMLGAPGIQRDLDTALRGLVVTTNWAELGQQFALLRTIPTFERVYLAVSRHRLDAAIVFQYETEMEPRRFADHFALTYNLMTSLSPLLQKFKLNAEQIDAISKALSVGAAAAVPAAVPVVSVLETALRLHEVRSGPCGNFIAVCPGGIHPELPKSFKIGYYAVRNRWHWYPSLVAFAWEPQNGGFHGKRPWLFKSLDATALQHTLRLGLTEPDSPKPAY